MSKYQKKKIKPSNNGRLNLLENVNVKFSMQDQIPVDDNSTDFREALNGTWEETNLSRVFFCKENINIIQNSIRSNVFKLTNIVIDPQSIDTIKIIMRSIYFQNAKHQLDLSLISFNYFPPYFKSLFLEKFIELIHMSS